MFHSHTLSLVFLEYLVLKWFREFVEDSRQEGEGLYSVLSRLEGLYGVWCLHRHSALLYQGLCYILCAVCVCVCVCMCDEICGYII